MVKQSNTGDAKEATKQGKKNKKIQVTLRKRQNKVKKIKNYQQTKN